MTGTPAIALRAKLLVALFAIGVAALLCEVGARAMFPAPPEPLREPQLYYQSDPALGFIHVPNQSGYLDDGLATINELGLRGPLPADPRPDGLVRVLAIGDSTTFGWGVNDDGAYPAQLEARLRSVFPGRSIEVVNGGVGAYDLKRATRLLAHFTPRLKPDIVLVGLFWNDLPYERMLPGDPAPKRVPAQPSGPPGASGRSGPFRIGNDPSTLNRILRRSRALFALRHAWLGLMAPTSGASNLVQWEMALLEGRQGPAIDLAWQDMQETLAEIGQMASEAGCTVGVLTIPIRAQVEGEYPDAAYQSRVRSIAESLGMFVVDPLPRLRAAADRTSLFIPYDRMHLTAAGNALMAEEAFEALGTRPEFAAVQAASRRSP